MRRQIIALLALLTATVGSQSQQITYQEANNLCKTTSRSWVSVHDPSVVHTTGNTFYIIGSHIGWARSTDNMQSWQGLDNGSLFGVLNASGKTEVTSYSNAFSTNVTTSVKALVNGEVKEVQFGNFDAKSWAHGDQDNWTIDGNMWAPDIVYNPNSKKWCMYMSLNGDSWHSVIVLLTANSITGPYVYQGPVTFSGFINATTPEISWKKTDLELVIGEQSSLPQRYNLGTGWGNYWPNNIDPCAFFDEEGGMWLVYGSWSGGIFMLKLDKETGLRDYTVSYSLQNDGSGRPLSDPYFGKRIAGGYYVSGEGPYIQHIGDYYYLFMSYGGFARDGGYEMRVFRSANPNGPYVDAQGTSAIYSRWEYNVGPGATTNRGMKLMGAYNNWGIMTIGECAQGHNSATLDNQGRAFVVYHTRFNDGTNGHQVRTHQLFVNQRGWLVAAPFQFDGETENNDSIAKRCLFTKEEIAGTYKVLIHKYRMDHANMEEVTPIELTLNDNGRVTGDLTGTWALTEGTGYVRVTVGSVAYYGVVIEQTVDGTSMKAVCFTATADSGVAIWGYKVEDRYAVAYTAKNYTAPIKENANVSKHIPLYGNGYYGAKIEWESSVPEVISNTGKYNPADTATRVTLTLRISAGTWKYEQAYNVTAQKATDISGDYRTGIVAYYDFDKKPTVNAYDETQQATYGKKASGTATTLVTDPARMGQVAYQYAGTYANASYTRFVNPLQGRTGLDGFTVSMLVKRADLDDLTGTLWAFTDKQGTMASVSQRLFLTGNAYVGFTNGTDYFDINKPDDGSSSATTSYIPADWQLVTLTCSADEGVNIYVNGTRRVHKKFASSAGSSTTVAKSAQLFDYQHVLDFITTAGFFQLGVGSTYGSAEAWFDDLIIYDRALPQADVRALNTAETRVTDFTDAIIPVVVDVLRRSAASDDVYYDMRGQRIQGQPAQRGVYIHNGKKIVVR